MLYEWLPSFSFGCAQLGLLDQSVAQQLGFSWVFRGMQEVEAQVELCFAGLIADLRWACAQGILEVYDSDG